MQHLIAKATVTETDQELGTFTALVSAWVEDRQGDTIDQSAFDQSIQDWQSSGKYLPLLFEHSTKAVGSIDPDSMHTTEEGLVVSGEVDRSTDEGEQVWRQIKDNTASFSIGFASESRPRKRGKGREITEIDLLEISATSTPVQGAARVLDWKSATSGEETESPDLDDMTDAELKAYSLAAVARVDMKASRPIQIARFPC